jgi:hypothetical protein
VGSPFAAQGQHVRRQVAAVHVQAGLQQGQQQAAGATGRIAGWLPLVFDDRPVVGDLLGARDIELRHHWATRP